MPNYRAAHFGIWDIVRVPFPYTDRPILQRRPALIVGQHHKPGSPHLLWLLMITSATHRRWTGDIEISDQVQAGLPALSMVRCAKIATVETSGIETIGSLGAPERKAVRGVLLDHLASLVEFPVCATSGTG